MNSSLMLSAWGKRLGRKLMKTRLTPVPIDKNKRWNIVRGDLVQVINGHCEGEKGKVVAVLRDQNRIIVDGVNMRSRNIKPTSDGTPGKKVIKPCSLEYSKVMLVDPSTGLPTKVARRFLEDGTKVRVSKKTGQIIPKPDPLFDRKMRSNVVGPLDTAPEDVFKVSFLDYEKYLPFLYAKEKSKAASV